MDGFGGRQPNFSAELENDILNIHLVMVLVSTLGGLGFVIEGALLKWEFWVLPIILLGIAIIWVVYITQHFPTDISEGIYVSFIMFAGVFHGVHQTSMFDLSLITVLIMITFVGTFKRRYQNYALIEYFALICAQWYMAVQGGGIRIDVLTVSRIILHISTVLIVYSICRNVVIRGHKSNGIIKSYVSEVKRTNEAMEDFLANISHEFRTPINVVTGMSSILMKEEGNDKITAINEAGLRLADQIEDILDYNEIISDRLIITEERYRIDQVVNEVVSKLRPLAAQKNLELIMDLDPRMPRVMNGDISRIKKILLHLTSNAVKFTEKGGLYVKISTANRNYGVNLDIEVTDTGKGMSRSDIEQLSDVLYQADKGRDRSTGGIGLGLTIVYGFTHAMGGFVRIESEEGRGTTVLVSIPQTVDDSMPCLVITQGTQRCVVTYIRPEKYRIPQIRDHYHRMIENMSKGLKIPVHSAGTPGNLRNLCEHMNVTHIFTGQYEYETDGKYLAELSRHICVVVNVESSYDRVGKGNILYIPHPIYGVPIVNILNAGDAYMDLKFEDTRERPVFTGARALIVDDEMMNLVVASGLFKEYGMVTETAGSGAEAIEKYRDGEYDIVFMDHMMPGMDGIEAMKKIKEMGREKGKTTVVVALTANAVSGAKEMFMEEGFDGFIAKPIETSEFERVMHRVLPPELVGEKGGRDL